HSISFFVMTPPPHRSTLFPYTTLFRSKSAVTKPNTNSIQVPDTANTLFKSFKKYYWNVTAYVDIRGKKVRIQSDPAYFEMGMLEDRKSTRLNSSHVKISYAVFCLKKKT